MAAHSATATLDSCFSVGLREAIRRLSSLHAFSIGERSGDLGGHSRTRPGRCATRNDDAKRLLCAGALSCWKMRAGRALVRGMRSFRSIPTYDAAVTLPHDTNADDFRAPKHAQNICFGAEYSQSAPRVFRRKPSCASVRSRAAQPPRRRTAHCPNWSAGAGADGKTEGVAACLRQ